MRGGGLGLATASAARPTALHQKATHGCRRKEQLRSLADLVDLCNVLDVTLDQSGHAGARPSLAPGWGRLTAGAEQPLPAVESLLGATALEHDLGLVTRRENDFAGLPVQIFNPWAN